SHQQWRCCCCSQMTAQPWVEKYRPLCFSEVVGNKKSISLLSNLAAKRVSIPHLLICGPSGCGKTVCVDILCNTMIPENRGARMLRLSSFDERGIDNVRTTVKNFARGRVGTEPTPTIAKIVVLDEADSMTPGAFQALRRIMDVYSSTTRFIIVCNNSTKIIEPIQSRCAILRFSKVDDAQLRLRIRQVCDMAGVEYDPGGIGALACVADGDVRSAINSLASIVSGFRRLTSENVYRTCRSPQPAKIVDIVDLLRNKGGYVEACRKLRGLCGEGGEGYSPTDILSSFFKALSVIDVRESQRIEIAKVIGLVQNRVLSGASSYLQLAAMLWSIAETFD
ncbi:unnamed protein product, partial [Ectocarpus sp. 4 AP-2014]